MKQDSPLQLLRAAAQLRWLRSRNTCSDQFTTRWQCRVLHKPRRDALRPASLAVRQTYCAGSSGEDPARGHHPKHLALHPVDFGLELGPHSPARAVEIEDGGYDSGDELKTMLDVHQLGRAGSSMVGRGTRCSRLPSLIDSPQSFFRLSSMISMLRTALAECVYVRVRTRAPDRTRPQISAP